MHGHMGHTFIVRFLDGPYKKRLIVLLRMIFVNCVETKTLNYIRNENEDFLQNFSLKMSLFYFEKSLKNYIGRVLIFLLAANKSIILLCMAAV